MIFQQRMIRDYTSWISKTAKDLDFWMISG